MIDLKGKKINKIYCEILKICFENIMIKSEKNEKCKYRQKNLYLKLENVS